MWLIVPLVLGLALILASIALGGVFTLVTIPIVLGAAVIVLGWGFFARMMGERKADAQGGTSVPSTAEAAYDPSGEATTPGQIADARHTAP